jgi:DnaK suppressor protein
MSKLPPGITVAFLKEMETVLKEMLQPLLVKAREEERPDKEGEKVGGTKDDYASASSQKHIAGKLREADMARKRAIEAALERIAKKTYGVCIDCCETIAERRLRALPYALVCLDCKQDENNSDKGRSRRDSVPRNGNV